MTEPTPTMAGDSASTVTAPTTGTPDTGGAVATVRRLVVYILLAIMVIIAAVGLSGLLGDALGANTLIVGDNSHLAGLLASSLIGTPLAGVLWWLSWRDTAIAKDRRSVAWALYVGFVYLVSLIIAVNGLLGCLGTAIGGQWNPGDLANGIVWGMVFAWHAWMLHHRAKGPTRMPGVALTLGSLFGLGLTVGWAISLLGGLITAAIESFTAQSVAGTPWWVGALQSLVWLAGGFVVWWWHWQRRGVHRLATGFAQLLLVLITGLVTLGVTLVGMAVALQLILRLVVGDSASPETLLLDLGPALAASLVGAVAMVYHRARVAAAPGFTVRGTTLVSSGVSVIGAAAGVGVVINALLGALVEPLVDSGHRTLLLGGIAALLVFGTSWWLCWKPLQAARPERSNLPGRRVYLIAIFGVSALVAMIALLVIGYRLFEFLLSAVAVERGLLELIRAPLGVLVATLLVSIYHFSLWRTDASRSDQSHERRIGRVVLVATEAPDGFGEALAEATGASFTTMQPEHPSAAVDTAAVLAALDDVTAARVLVIPRKDSVEVIPLRG